MSGAEAEVEMLVFWFAAIPHRPVRVRELTLMH